MIPIQDAVRGTDYIAFNRNIIKWTKDCGWEQAVLDLQYYPCVCLHIVRRTENAHSGYSASWPDSKWATRKTSPLMSTCLVIAITVFRYLSCHELRFRMTGWFVLRNSTQKMKKTTFSQNYFEQCAHVSGYLSATIRHRFNVCCI